MVKLMLKVDTVEGENLAILLSRLVGRFWVTHICSLYRVGEFILILMVLWKETRTLGESKFLSFIWGT